MSIVFEAALVCLIIDYNGAADVGTVVVVLFCVILGLDLVRLIIRYGSLIVLGIQAKLKPKPQINDVDINKPGLGNHSRPDSLHNPYPI
jgi:hypothetical protein